MKAEPESLHDIMKQVRDQLIILNEKKQTAIDNQVKFEKKWSGFKKVAVGTALIAPLLSMATGIIDPSQDFPIIIQRFNEVAGQLITVFKE